MTAILAAQLGVDGEDNHTIAIKPGVRGLEAGQTANHQTGGEQKQRAQSDLESAKGLLEQTVAAIAHGSF